MMETAVSNGMCRCCASEGAFKDVKSTYHWMGEEEVYADMLRECFDINLNVSDQGEDGGICEVCITQLRNAVNFKKQVLHTEEQFKKHLQNKTLFRPNIVKVEVNPDEDSDDNNASGDDGFSAPEFEVPIKTELSDEPKPKKRGKAAATTTRAKKAKADNGETSSKRTDPEPLMIEIEVDTSLMIPPDDEPEVKMNEVEKHRENIRTILLCTNASPIGRYASSGYTCCFCSEIYSNPKDLKTHSNEVHGEGKISRFMSTYTMLNYIVKLDITGLRCEICTKPINELPEIIKHLATEHDMFFHTDIDNHIVPFRFDSDTMQCVDCSSRYSNFKILLEHMNTHYGNHICEVCEAGFVNKRMLQAHMYRHKIGVFKCGFCKKVFDTRVKMKVHERMVHFYIKKRPTCSVCGKKFEDFQKMIAHEARSHGLKRQFKCDLCCRMFTSEQSYEIHKRDCATD